MYVLQLGAHLYVSWEVKIRNRSSSMVKAPLHHPTSRELISPSFQSHNPLSSTPVQVPRTTRTDDYPWLDTTSIVTPTISGRAPRNPWW
ncbi:hypothetical protein PoMZ_03822 [Pyricularia oryzae]|uniref:Uncharacterized protein n=1 Tax=Pyricularia oryzae TaxID=318829 RepID=A0A4P7NDD1_PYROR|nr:hypothetical protein PoMZ_03822 [Pyricularia oryzae]